MKYNWWINTAFFHYLSSIWLWKPDSLEWNNPTVSKSLPCTLPSFNNDRMVFFNLSLKYVLLMIGYYITKIGYQNKP